MEGQDKKYLAWGLYISAESQIFSHPVWPNQLMIN